MYTDISEIDVYILQVGDTGYILHHAIFVNITIIITKYLLSTGSL